MTGPLARMPRALAPVVLVAAALLVSAVSVLDPARRATAWIGFALAAGAVALLPRSRGRRAVALAAVVAACWSVAASAGPEFRGDAGSYFVYLRSALFDHDLDFGNDWDGLERPAPPPTPRGRPSNTQSVGPAVAWSPFFAAAHLYVRWERGHGRDRYAADGFSAPYRRAPVLGTLATVALGAALLGAALARRFGTGVGWTALVAAVVASPVAYYAFVVPAMAHGCAFGAAAALMWACVRARESPSARRWAVVGLLLGVAVLMRWQAAVWGLFVIILALQERRHGRARWSWLAAAAGLSALAFVPQLLAWHALYGRFLTVPQGAGYMDWSAPHLFDVLFSADHGLFAWTPIAWLGLAGLVAGLRRDPTFHGAALLVCAATAWVNGSVTDWDWAAGDAFGARRFDVAVPLLAWGLAALLCALRPVLARAPLAAPVALLVALCAWNVGFIALFREGRYPAAAPLDRLAADQARLARSMALRAADALSGRRGRALAYAHLDGEYLFTHLHPDGVIELAAEDRLLRDGWSARANRAETPHYRWALAPAACLLVPLSAAHDLTLTVTARAPRRALPQTLTTVWNDGVAGTAELGSEWTDLEVAVLRARVHEGENRLCFLFSNAAPGDEGPAVAAAISTVRVRLD